MSVSKSQYIFYGVSIPYFEDNDEEQYWKFETEFDNITLLSDGMNGDYSLIGKIICKDEGDRYRDGMLADTEPLNFGILITDEMKRLVKESIKKHFPEVDQECSLHIVTHYT